MSFEIKNKLMELVQNDAVAYKIAFDFVGDDLNKLTVFTKAFNESVTHASMESRSAAVTQVASARWDVMYPVDDTK